MHDDKINTAWRKKKVTSFPNRNIRAVQAREIAGNPKLCPQIRDPPWRKLRAQPGAAPPDGARILQEPRDPQEGTPLQPPAPDPEHLRRRSGQRGPRGPPGSHRFPEGWRRRHRAAPHRSERGGGRSRLSPARRNDAAVTSVRGHRAGRAATPAPRRRRAKPARTPGGRARPPARSLVPGSAERA